MAETAQLTVRLDLAGNFSSGITKAQGQLNGLARSAGRVGKGVGQVGAGFARAGLLLGGAAVAGLTAAAKAGIDFEDAFSGVVKTVDEADLTKAGLSFEGLAKSFRTMATEIPISAVQFAELGETAGALGVKAKDIEEFVRVTALMGVTTNLSANEAADAFGRIGTILGLTGDDYEELADSIVAVGNAGASTEAEITEITKRFAAQAKQAGLTKEEMVGLASATASLGFEAERGGTALARVFANMSTNIALANDKGKAFAKVTGRSIKDLVKDINRGKGLDVFQDFLQGLKGLNPADAARVLKAVGITNTSDRTIFLAMSDQLPFVNEQLEIAKNATGELLEEATKKFATTASKIQLFKNNVIEAGISLSEGFLPAVGRSLDKLSTALKDPTTKGDIAQLGKDIGAAIDSIDWDAVLKGAREFAGALKGTLAITLEILKAVNKLPNEIKAAGLAFLALNKLSGGLIASGVGNIVGGVAETAIRGLGSRLPKVGALFAQPVFVTNWPIGGLGGGVPGAGGKGGLGRLGGVVAGGIIIGGVALSLESINQFAEANAAAAARGLNPAETAAIRYYQSSTADQAFMAKRLGYLPSKADFDSGLAKLGQTVVTGDHEGAGQRRPAVPMNPRSSDPAYREWQTTVRAGNTKIVTAVENLKASIGPSLSQTPVKLEQNKVATIEAGLKAKNASMETKAQIASSAMVQQALLGAQMATTRMTASTTQGAVRNVAPPIVGAIRANRPVVTTIVNVTATHVTKSTTIQNRYGPGSGSGGQNDRSGPLEY